MNGEGVVTGEWNRLNICNVDAITEFETERGGRKRKGESIRGGGGVRERRKDGETWKVTPPTR